ncbi:hypothetical protein P389DRAFT_169559 [Cystobasidium minutum MCA 4210]|uniref:uncharacterized protein n=1 Tax=Cystobasidium minutum MCA 4210 TaxID=1397322 RepID=UPI0034CEAB3E|eukprot:jgi/Rhomi1/169559/fgenesh1_kg.3_\
MSTSSQSAQSKGKGRADNDDSQQPEQQSGGGPQVARGSSSMNTRHGQDDAKRRLIRSNSKQPGQEEHNHQESRASSTPTIDNDSQQSPSAASSNTLRSPTQEPASSLYPVIRGESLPRSMTPFSHHRPPRLRIREDVTKSTSFDRARDGDELYNLWVGPP